MENTSEEEKQKRIEEYAKAYCRNNVDYKGEEYDRIRHSFSLHEVDPMFIEAATLILQTQLGSTSLIQRRMKLGYNRAGRIMDQLEEFGVVGHSQGSKAREVKVRSSEELNSILDKIYNGETGNRDDFYETNKFEIDKKIEDYKEEFRRKNEENEEFLEELHTGVHYMN